MTKQKQAEKPTANTRLNELTTAVSRFRQFFRLVEQVVPNIEDLPEFIVSTINTLHKEYVKLEKALDVGFSKHLEEMAATKEEIVAANDFIESLHTMEKSEKATQRLLEFKERLKIVGAFFDMWSVQCCIASTKGKE